MKFDEMMQYYVGHSTGKYDAYLGVAPRQEGHSHDRYFGRQFRNGYKRGYKNNTPSEAMRQVGRGGSLES